MPRSIKLKKSTLMPTSSANSSLRLLPLVPDRPQPFSGIVAEEWTFTGLKSPMHSRNLITGKSPPNEITDRSKNAGSRGCQYPPFPLRRTRAGPSVIDHAIRFLYAPVPLWLLVLAGASLLWFLREYYRERWAKLAEVAQTLDFKPHSIHIDPQWHTLLTDYGLVNDTTWLVLCHDEHMASGGSGHDVFRDGINFTAVTPTPLYFWNDFHTFKTSIRFSVPIEKLRPAQAPEERFGTDGPPLLHEPYAPRFYVRRHLLDLEFGLITQASMLQKLRTDFLPPDDESELIRIATLTPFCFSHYYQKGQTEADRQYIQKRLKDDGWEREDWPPDHFSLKHKYLTVTYHEIPREGGYE